MRKTFSIPSLLIVIVLSFAQMQCSETNAGNNGEAAKDATAQTDTTAAKKKKDQKIDERVPVEVTTIKQGEISSFILLSSNLETEKMADVYPRVQGIVEKIMVEEGDYVQKGQELLKLEAQEYELAEAGAKVSFDQQKQAFERAEAMYNKQLLSKEEFEQSRYTMQNARIDWEKTKLNLKYTHIESPISGVIGERLCRPGDRIQPSDKLFSVINTQEIIAIVHVPEKEIGRLKKNQKAFLTSDNIGDQQFKGWIKRVSPVVDPQSGTFKVTIGVNNEAGKLRPGMFVNVHIVTETRPNAVPVPKTAVVYENEAMHVFVVRDSLAHKIKLDPGFQNYAAIEALDGIRDGDKVIVVGQAGLKDQSKVKIVSEKESIL